MVTVHNKQRIYLRESGLRILVSIRKSSQIFEVCTADSCCIPYMIWHNRRYDAYAIVEIPRLLIQYTE